MDDTVYKSGPVLFRQGDTATRPTRAWVEKGNGEHIELHLKRVPNLHDEGVRWVASPPGDQEVIVGPGDHLRIDVLPAGHSVEFDRVWSPEADQSSDTAL